MPLDEAVRGRRCLSKSCPHYLRKGLQIRAFSLSSGDTQRRRLGRSSPQAPEAVCVAMKRVSELHRLPAANLSKAGRESVG